MFPSVFSVNGGYLQTASSLELESTTGYTFTPCVGFFTSPGLGTYKCGVNEIA